MTSYYVLKRLKGFHGSGNPHGFLPHSYVFGIYWETKTLNKRIRYVNKNKKRWYHTKNHNWLMSAAKSKMFRHWRLWYHFSPNGLQPSGFHIKPPNINPNWSHRDTTTAKVVGARCHQLGLIFGTFNAETTWLQPVRRKMISQPSVAKHFWLGCWH
jgi:hypothetical protein